METSPGAALSMRLKQATRELHVQAERSGVMVELLGARISRAAYCALLRNLHAMYAALEAALDAHADSPQLRGLCLPGLRRLPGLAHDLDRLHTGPWRSELALVPAALAYVQRLRALAQSAPVLLAAHAYVRYLGDLHGGQMLARRVQHCFDLDAEAGTAFYSFGDAAEVERLRHGLRAALDALALGPAEADALIAEACAAFRLHRQLFEELQPLAG